MNDLTKVGLVLFMCGPLLLVGFLFLVVMDAVEGSGSYRGPLPTTFTFTIAFVIWAAPALLILGTVVMIVGLIRERHEKERDRERW